MTALPPFTAPISEPLAGCAAAVPPRAAGRLRRRARDGGDSARWFPAWPLILLGGLLAAGTAVRAAEPGSPASAATADSLAWPAATREARPWAYWWWMGSAVDRENLTRELTRYRDAGMGGLHLVPIYGAKGWEENYVDYLSPRWLDLLAFAAAEARRLGLGLDMTTGSGWCFGGPHVAEQDANALAVPQVFDVAAGVGWSHRFPAPRPQALMAFGPHGSTLDLLPRLDAGGAIAWRPEGGPWQVIAVTQQPSGQRVKRAGPGGTGWMLNLLHPPAMTRYLGGFERAFASFTGPLPRAQYHDSYEYRSDWAPGLLAQFERRRGYRLQEHLDVLFPPPEPARGRTPAAAPSRSPADAGRARRVQADVRETISDLLIEESLPQWTAWARGRGMLTRNQAHGSPGNLLDLYALADIPETEMFNRDRNPLIAKLASSAAHVSGRRLVAAECGTWLREHFTETLGDLKLLLDDLFVSGVNHVLYHGTCYSPDAAPWPGWLFYASTQMNPRNPIWRDAPALNAYVTRCQSVLQEGRADHDVLLYWPIHDLWHRDGALERKLTVHRLQWFEPEAIGRVAAHLWRQGYAFDYVSDRQLAGARVRAGGLALPGGDYRVVVVPACQHLPLATLRQILSLAEAGAQVIFEGDLPRDVPGWSELASRRAELTRLLGGVHLQQAAPGLQRATVGRGAVLVGDLEAALAAAGVARESLVDHPGLRYARRRTADGRTYFLANRGKGVVDGWVPLAVAADAVVLLDPLTGRAGVGNSRRHSGGGMEVRLRLDPGGSLLLRTRSGVAPAGPAWAWAETAGPAVTLTGDWRLDFLAGGPEMPPALTTARLASWTALGGEAAQRFAGTARYTLTFAAPAGEPPAGGWRLDLGRVADSARVRVNGAELGAVFLPPFRVVVPDLRPAGNVLEIEVTNVAANRIRDLDRRKVTWRNFHDINFVNLDYKPFDASRWPVRPAGLLGPITLTPLRMPSLLSPP
jgi:hypothetical protein